MSDNTYERVEDDAPDRCQGVSSHGQCRFRAGDGMKYCRMHGGAPAAALAAKKDQRRYKLAKYQERVNQFADEEGIKNLGEEIGILRMTLEQVILACVDNSDIQLYAPKISDLVSKIEKLVVTCTKLEMSAGIVLSKKAAFTLASQIVDIVAKHVSDPDAVALVADEIGSAIANIKSDDTDL